MADFSTELDLTFCRIRILLNVAHVALGTEVDVAHVALGTEVDVAHVALGTEVDQNLYISIIVQ